MRSAKKRRMMIVIPLLVMMLIGCGNQSASVLAVSETSRSNYSLAKGVTESTVYATETGRENVRIHLLRVNKGAKISLRVSTAKYYKKNSTKKARKKAYKKWKKNNWGFATVGKHARKYESTKDKKGRVIAAFNGDFYETNKKKYNGVTLGNLIMEGNKVRSSKREPFFALLKNGKYEIRDPKGKTKDVAEAVSGYRYLVNDGKVVVGKTSGKAVARYPQQAIGITGNNDVVIANIEGREPTSLGTDAYNMAKVLKQQGCVKAIMLDGGGSATFMTKRKKGGLKMRNNSMDGAPREVSSAILIVKNKKGGKGKVTGKRTVSMKSGKTGLFRSKTGLYRYRINGKAGKSGFVIINGKSYLFNKKGNGLTKKVKIGKTAYFFKKGKLARSSDKKAGNVVIGHCGANNKGKNLLFAYHSRNKKLMIGRNPFIKKNSGKMANWGTVAEVPWNIYKFRIKSIFVGKGVKNIGDNFLCITLNPFNDGIRNKNTKVRSLVLPKSLKTIGKLALYNNYHLKKVVIPSNVRTIKTGAFYWNNGTKFIFKGKRPPKMSKNSFTNNKKTGKKTVFKVPRTNMWIHLANSSSGKKRIGLSGKVKY